jgi:hypothetical protein
MDNTNEFVSINLSKSYAFLTFTILQKIDLFGQIKIDLTKSKKSQKL